MSCAQLVLAHIGRTTCNKIHSKRESQMFEYSAFSQGRLIQQVFFVVSVWCRTSEDRRGRGTAGLQILQCGWVHGRANTPALHMCKDRWVNSTLLGHAFKNSYQKSQIIGTSVSQKLWSCTEFFSLKQKLRQFNSLRFMRNALLI